MRLTNGFSVRCCLNTVSIHSLSLRRQYCSSIGGSWITSDFATPFTPTRQASPASARRKIERRFMSDIIAVCAWSVNRQNLRWTRTRLRAGHLGVQCLGSVLIQHAAMAAHTHTAADVKFPLCVSNTICGRLQPTIADDMGIKIPSRKRVTEPDAGPDGGGTAGRAPTTGLPTAWGLLVP